MMTHKNRDGSNEGSQHIFSLRNKKNYLGTIISELSSKPHLICSSVSATVLQLRRDYRDNLEIIFNISP